MGLHRKLSCNLWFVISPLGRPKQRWDDNIKMEIGWEGVDWMHLAQDMDQ